ncbi:MAG: mrdB [Chitinophagaceae bacterium]|nr:mrdB [Chitinophagaceae bacterium]
MRNEDKISSNIDWITVGFYSLFVLLGWFNIFAVVYDPEAAASQSMFDFSMNAGKQLMWICTAVVLIIMILVIDFKFYATFAYVIYGLVILLLIVTMIFAKEINGSRSWLDIGFTRIQPAEFAKFATALALAKYMSPVNVKFEYLETKLVTAFILALPCVFILLQNETGSTLVFSAFVLVLYREGLSGVILFIGVLSALLLVLTLIYDKFIIVYVIGALAFVIILYLIQAASNSTRKKMLWRNIFVVMLVAGVCSGVVFGVDFFVNKVLQEHQRNRVMVLIDQELDPKGVGYHVRQSKIAIGSGEFWGKGFLEGTQTKFDFVPEQSTDFIFCTIGEEHGWFGSTLLIGLYVAFMLRLVFLAERQKDKFARIYGYSVACLIFIHFMVNIGMTIGVFPVIGIPLPFFSYGGSSLWSFTILLFIFLKLDAHRGEVLVH